MGKSSTTSQRNLMPRIAANATALFVLASCSKSDVPDEPVSQQIKLKASTESTRTTLGEDYSVRWSSGDSFALTSNSASEIFTLTDGAGTTTATFTGVKPAGTGFAAIYPDSTIIGRYGNEIGLLLPSICRHTDDGSFPRRMNPMIAYGGDGLGSLSFRNLCGVIELQITGSPYARR